jgi:hypothetical protein
LRQCGDPLQNNGNLLPLKNGGAGLKIAFIGPHANSSDAYNSNYHGQMPDWMTLHTPYEIALSRGLQATYSWVSIVKTNSYDKLHPSVYRDVTFATSYHQASRICRARTETPRTPPASPLLLRLRVLPMWLLCSLAWIKYGFDR